MHRLARSLDNVVLWVRSDEEDPDNFFWRGKGASAGEISCFQGQCTPEPKAGWRVADTRPASLPACLADAGPKSPGTFYFLARR